MYKIKLKSAVLVIDYLGPFTKPQIISGSKAALKKHLQCGNEEQLGLIKILFHSSLAKEPKMSTRTPLVWLAA